MPQPTPVAPAAVPVPRKAWLLDRLGFALFTVGLLACLFVSWTLYGTNVYAHLTAPNVSIDNPVMGNGKLVHPIKPVPIGDRLPIGIPSEGTPVGRIIIPSIGVNWPISAGTTESTLSHGPGIWLGGVMPGMPGNATISGHRTTHGAPFRHIDELKPGDKIIVELSGATPAVFEVRGTKVVLPTDVGVTHQTPGVRLTMTSCNPAGSDIQRYVVQSELVQGDWADKALPAKSWTFEDAG